MERNPLSRIRAAAALLVVCALFSAAGTAYGQIEDISMWLEKTHVSPGEAIVVHFTAPQGFSPDAWIGLMPTGVPHDFEVVNDQYDFRKDTIQYRYLSGRTAGTLLFTAPAGPGMYDFRLYGDESGSVEWGVMSFFVVAPRP
jgi:hypothetical protein